MSRDIDALTSYALTHLRDRWWTARPLHRHYYELVLSNGRSITVFRDLRADCWYRQQA